MGIDVNKGKSTGRGDEWYTPAWLIEALGEFDTDPAAPVQNHWTAKTCYTKRENGLRLPWNGRTFLNPPYSKIDPWIYRLTAHRNAIALVFARMDTQWMDQALCFADGVCFLTGRISFVDINGKGSKSANAPSILLAY
ncbi:MAG: adenine methyltransferase, partial [Alphaproteobacteria bacterium HGW-Alphaproteobacteria-11]